MTDKVLDVCGDVVEVADGAAMVSCAVIEGGTKVVALDLVGATKVSSGCLHTPDQHHMSEVKPSIQEWKFVQPESPDLKTQAIGE